MPTNITAFKNHSDRSAIAFNAENIGNSFLTSANSEQPTSPGLWVSWHKDKPLVLSTTKGICHIWDSDWKVHGKWEGSSNEIIFLDGQAVGVGGDVQVNIAADGEITMSKAN